MAESWLVALQGDPNSHGGGGLIADNPQTVFINNIPVIEHGDPANADSLCPIPPHCNPETENGSGTVRVYTKPLHRMDDDRICGAVTVVQLQSTVFAGGPKAAA
jgi:uncharacterized Zn-binding protein involved in type VI secretion